MEWGENGSTYIVDACNGFNGEVDWEKEDSVFRKHFTPKFIKETTEKAYYDYFVKQDIKIDYLHIDAGHSFDGCKKDFELYSQIMNKGGIITIHDTDKDYVDNFVELEGHKGDDLSGPANFVKTIDKRKFEVFNLFNHNIVKWKPFSVLNDCEEKMKPQENLVTVCGYNTTMLHHMLDHYQYNVKEIFVCCAS